MLTLLTRTLPVTVGLVLVALLIWYGGPYLEYAGYKPLDTGLSRLVLIAAVCAGFAVKALLDRRRAQRASAALAQAAVAAPDAGRPSADLVQLRERFEEAVAMLKRRRGGRGSLYELPWYVIIGAPGSGKTTALVNSGLHFPLEQKSGRNAVRGVGGTRNCDWWFTDEAVFLDTAGRFTTQDSDASADGAGWKEFLGLLRKYRPRRPVNGIILTVSAQDLLMQGHVDIDGYVDAARRRLAELNRELRMQVPVYVMVTKCDLVSGFTEYFEDMGQDARAQVWGVTFSYDETMQGEGPRLLASEVRALVERLRERVLARVEEARDTRRRTRIFGFPQQMELLIEPLDQVVHEVFAATRFDAQRPMLRGVYFTSGTQEGTPIDRLIGALGRGLSVAPDPGSPPGRGKAYFIHDLLTRVVLAESGLAGVDRRVELRKAAVQLGLYAAFAGMAALAVLLLTISYRQNRAYVEAVGFEARALDGIAPPAGAALEETLPRLDALRAVRDSATVHAANTPWSMRWGLYKGNSVGAAANDAYVRELQRVFLKHVAERFAQRLRDNADDPPSLYGYLKAYLMLGQPEYMDRVGLLELADIEWEVAHADEPERMRRVKDHFAALIEAPRLDPVGLDQTLISQVRTRLKRASMPGLIFRFIRIQFASGRTPGPRLDEVGIGAERVLSRRSGARLTEPVPVFYTKPLFLKVAADGVQPLVRAFLDESWVWGDDPPVVESSAALEGQVLDLYETDYIEFWDRLQNDVTVVPLANLEAAKETLATLAQPESSPLRKVLELIDEHTFIVPPAEPSAPAPEPGLADALRERFRERAQRGAAAAETAPPAPGSRITAHFAPLRRLLAGDPGSAPIDVVLGRLGQLHAEIEPIGTAIGQKPPGDPQVIASVGTVATALRRDAERLPPGIGSAVEQVANGATQVVRSGVRETIDTRYRQEVVSACERLVAGKYPFSPDGPDLPPSDFADVFGPNGVYDEFFRRELANLVDASQRSWRWLRDDSGASVGGSKALLHRMEQAHRIREIFFQGGGPRASLRFDMTPDRLDETVNPFTLEVNGATLTYAHGPMRAVAVTWPGAGPGVAAATFQTQDGRSTIVKSGAWALFKLLDDAQVRTLAPDRFLVRLEADGHWAELVIDAGTSRNPFGSTILQQFRCQ